MTDESTPSFSTYAARRVTFLLRVRDHDHHGSLLVHLMKRARQNKIAGATAFEAFEGFGGSGHIRRSHSLSDDAPVTLVMIDRSEKIDAFLRDADDLLEGVFITITDVDVVEL